MSGSETGIIASREPYTVGTQNSPTAMQNMQPPFSSEGPTVYRPVSGTPFFQQRSSGSLEGEAVGSIISQGYGSNISLSGDQIRKKRGRPRKYGPDGNMALSLVSVSPSGTMTLPVGGFSSTSSAAHSYGGTPPSAVNKPRGRPPGSNKRQKLEGAAGVGFTPHVITVKAGEDVSSKIMSFSQHGPRAICILAANGAISNVTLRQPATSGGTVTYEGRFEILSLSGSYLPSESDGQISRTGGLSVSLAGPDGRVIGGSVAGLLTAAAPVQVVVGSFVAADNSRESKAGNQSEPLATIPKPSVVGGATGGSSPTSRGTASGSSGGPPSPFNQTAGPFNTITNPPQVMIWK